MVQISLKFNSNVTTKFELAYLSLLQKVSYFFKNGSNENNFSSRKYPSIMSTEHNYLSFSKLLYFLRIL